MKDIPAWHKKYHQMVRKVTSPEFLELSLEAQELQVEMLNYLAEHLGKPAVELQEQGYCLKTE